MTSRRPLPPEERTPDEEVIPERPSTAVVDAVSMLRVKDASGLPVRWTRHLRGLGLVPTPDARRLVGYINHGRWVADCINCGGGVACGPSLPEGCCLDCGHVFGIDYPADWRDAVRELEARPQRFRNWEPGETVQDLRDENTARGIETETRVR